MAANHNRTFLAEEVQAQRLVISSLLQAVAGLERATESVERSLNTLVAEMREDRQEARDERKKIVEQVNAQRMEQLQIALGLTDVKTDLGKVVATVDEHETERQRMKGGLMLAIASSRTAWILVGGLLLASATAYLKFFVH